MPNKTRSTDLDVLLDLLEYLLDGIIGFLQHLFPIWQLAQEGPVHCRLVGLVLLDADLVAGALQALQAGDDALPGEELLHQLEAGLLDGRGQVHDLIGDADLVNQALVGGQQHVISL